MCGSRSVVFKIRRYLLSPARLVSFLVSDGGITVRATKRQSAIVTVITAFFWVAPQVQAADLVIAMPNWPSGQATANILKVAISKEFGVEVELVELGALNAFVGLDRGTVDIHPEVWSPNLDDVVRKYAQEKGSVIITRHAVDAWQGLCATPAAAKQIRSVDDLKDPAKTADLDTDGDGRGEMWIGAPTWLSAGIEKVRAASYGYQSNLTLVETEEEVAMAAVDAATATDQPMIFACYAPHYVFELHNVTRLSEPSYDTARWQIVSASDPMWISKSNAPVAWPAAHFSIAYARALEAKYPEVVGFIEKMDLTTDEVTQMSYALEVEKQNPAAYAEAWVKEREARVQGWAGR